MCGLCCGHKINHLSLMIGGKNRVVDTVTAMFLGLQVSYTVSLNNLEQC